jgi:voltage-gated potassium channel
MFKFVKDQQHTNLFYVPRYHPIDTIVTRKFISQVDIIKAVEASNYFHLYNIANSINKQEQPEDKVVVLNYKKNTPYGCCIDRGSNVTIVFTSGFTEPMTGWFAYHIAKLGGFNYVSKEIESDPDNPTTYYNIHNENTCPNLRLFLDDIDRLSARPNSWVVPILESSGLRSRPEQLHFCYNTVKGDDSYNDPLARIKDYETFDKMYCKMSEYMSETYKLTCDRNKWYGVQKNLNIAYHLKADNVFTLRVEAWLWLFDSNFLEFTKAIADIFRETFDLESNYKLPYEMIDRQIGHDFGFGDYVD